MGVRVRGFLTFLLAFLFLSAPVRAEETEKPTLQQEIARRMVDMKDKRFITLNSENDLYSPGGRDENYTNGARITYFHLGEKPHPVFNNIDRILPTFTINPTTSIYYTLGHNLFTPKDITRTTQDPDDRPWAAFLYTSAGLVTITDNHIDEIEATVGIVGPAALGEQVQKFVHEHISDSPTPRGWDHQLKNEPGLMLSWERRWPELYGHEALGLSAGFTPHLGATVGNIYTYGSAGVNFRLSPFESRWQDSPIRVRPAMPGTGAFATPPDSFSWYLFSGVEGRAVARNIFLDGNTFADSHDVEKVPLVMDANAGIAFTYGAARLSYALIYRTKEFQKQDDPSVFGTVSLGYRF